MNATVTQTSSKKTAAKKAAPKMADLPTSTKVVGGVKGNPKGATKTPSVAEPLKLSIAIDASKALVEKLILGIKARGAKLDIDIHSAGCASLNHAAMHNDPTLLNRLVLALPKATRRNALVAWALKHGNVALNDGANRDEFPLVFAKDKTANIDAALAEPFWALRNVREGGNEWLYTDYITNVMKTLARVAADPKNKESAKAKAALDSLTAVNEALNTKPDNGNKAPEWVPGAADRRGPTSNTKPAAAVTAELPAAVH